MENKINLSELNKDDNKNNVIISSSIDLSNSILKNLINEIRYEYKFNKKLDLKNYINNKLSLLEEIEDFDGNNDDKLPASRGNASNIIFQLMIDPMKYLKNNEYENYE